MATVIVIIVINSKETANTRRNKTGCNGGHLGPRDFGGCREQTVKKQQEQEETRRGATGGNGGQLGPRDFGGCNVPARLIPIS